jgi:hypothetical protein
MWILKSEAHELSNALPGYMNVYGLFNGTVNSSNYIALNEWTLNRKQCGRQQTLLTLKNYETFVRRSCSLRQHLNL